MLEQVAIEGALRRAAVEAGIMDLHDRELEAFWTGVVSIIGITALNIARAKGECLELFSPHGEFDFEQVRRGVLLDSVEACTGLHRDVCSHMLTVLGKLIRQSGESEIWILGNVREQGWHPNSGYSLVLSKSLRVDRKPI